MKRATDPEPATTKRRPRPDEPDRGEPERPQRSERAGRRRGMWRDLLSMAITLSLLLVARSTLADHYRVPSGSMQPTVEIGDRVVVHKSAYGLRVPFSEAWLSDIRMPERGDVVVARSPEDGRVLLKRVVARAGDRVEVRQGRVWLNGEPARVQSGAEGLRERLDAGEHPLQLGWGGGPDFGPEVVPPGHVLLMGDNRGNSHDSRSFGSVPIEALLGRAVAVYVRDGALSWIDL